ncbi:helix-turn-helix transcriptional regulator [Brevundimonas nasdae]|uniref:helix-turn-helix domain-containing protein n=1 Tax=Brevundimonas nasdae TaxID=172043 RepID=UPI00301ADC76
MDWAAVVGQNVRKRRQVLGLSQEQLAHDADVTMRYLGAIERGQQNPSLALLVRIATALQCSPVDLFSS